jgi:hypothetical protein
LRRWPPPSLSAIVWRCEAQRHHAAEALRPVEDPAGWLSDDLSAEAPAEAEPGDHSEFLPLSLRGSDPVNTPPTARVKRARGSKKWSRSVARFLLRRRKGAPHGGELRCSGSVSADLDFHRIARKGALFK